MKYVHPIIFFLFFSSVWSCQSPDQHSLKVPDSPDFAPQYATGFSIQNHQITIQEPWPGAQNPFDFTWTSPPQKIVVTGTTALPYLELLGEGEKLVGFPGTSYIYSSFFRDRVDKGLIHDLGPDGQLNLELLFELEPDLVVVFDMGNESTHLDKIQQAGIPLLYNSDFLETSVLGRTEWIKVFGAILDKQAQADSIFNAIASDYTELQKKVVAIGNRPDVLSGILYGETWFLPGGQNGTAQLIQDAGGNYIWKDTPQTGWLELSYETVVEKAYQADYWLGVGTIKSRDEMISLDPRYEYFEALQQGNVYHYGKRISPAGGYDYFESGYARPDLILADLIKIFHPELVTDHTLVYFDPLD